MIRITMRVSNFFSSSASCGISRRGSIEYGGTHNILFALNLTPVDAVSLEIYILAHCKYRDA